MSTIKKYKLGRSYNVNNDVNKSFDFVGLYKTAAETNQILEKSHGTMTNDSTKNNVITSKRERSPFKNKKKRKQESIEISETNINASTSNSSLYASTLLNSKNTPNTSIKEQAEQVKSIMKNNSLTDHSMDSPRDNKPNGKSKKRNKSVSFMLDDNEEVVVKRTKSDDSIPTKSTENTRVKNKDKKKPIKKTKKYQQSEKENDVINVNKQDMDVDNAANTAQEKKPVKLKKKVTEPNSSLSTDGEVQSQESRKKPKKKQKSSPELGETESNKNIPTPGFKIKKLKKKKTVKSAATETEEENGEPNIKAHKMDFKPDIVEDLENLSIGDNAHTLTSLLDEMTVVDKDKQKKLRQKFNKNKKPKGPNKEQGEVSEDGNEKEKVKWNKRKWNKDKKGYLDDDAITTIVVVEGLPIKIMLTYKKVLTDLFTKYGLIKKIGLAEVYPTEESKPVFTTTVNFYSDGAAKEALELNNSEIEGSRIRVKSPLPPTATTVVVRSYAELTDQNLSSAFLGTGKIRSIRHLIKGKKSMATAFVEFDGPEAVTRALKKMADTKIGGKKVHVAKFEPRLKKKKTKEQRNDGDSAADADSEDSND